MMALGWRAQRRGDRRGHWYTEPLKHFVLTCTPFVPQGRASQSRDVPPNGQTSMPVVVNHAIRGRTFLKRA